MKKYIFAMLWLISVFMILMYSESVTNTTYTTLSSAFREVFPVLFPYSVVASLMVSVGGGEALGNILPVNKLFLMPSGASVPIICGALCGFPLGAKTACDMFEYGLFSKKTAEKVVSVSNNTGPSFVISIIGIKYFNSAEIGIVIYISQFVGTIIASLAINGKVTEEVKFSTKSVSFGCAFSEAVRSAVISCLYVCGFISVFSSLLFAASNLPAGLYGALCGFFEFTNGAKYGGNTGGIAGLFIAAFSVGWSGFSVIMQTMTYTYPTGLSIKPLIKIKIVTGILCGLICSMYFTKMRIQMLCSLLFLIIMLYLIRSKATIATKMRENSIFS